MYKKKIPLDLDCGVAIAMEVMGGKWKSCILYELEKGCKRPSELHRHFEDTSPRVINQQLKELEMHGMIEKTIYPELPPHVEYSITDDGRSLIPIIRMLEQWGNDFRPKMVRILDKSHCILLLLFTIIYSAHKVSIYKFKVYKKYIYILIRIKIHVLR